MKKGFTLVEIIVVISLITVIGVGTSAAIISSNNKKELDVLVSNEQDFNNALEVYLSSHEEVIENVNNNVEGAIVSLELLKNEGLISSDLNIDYKDNYYVVTNAFLSNNGIEGNIVKEECSNSVGLETIASWAKNNDTSSVLYFCPKTGGDGGLEKVNELLCSDIPYEEESLAYNIICNSKKVNERWQTSYRETPYTKAGEVVLDYEQILTKAEDDYGTSYYYRGNVVDNYMNFAGMCWRIMRIQGDGSVKLILEDKDTTCDSSTYTGNWSIGNAFYGAKQSLFVKIYQNYYGNGLCWSHTNYSDKNVLLDLVNPEVIILNQETLKDLKQEDNISEDLKCGSAHMTLDLYNNFEKDKDKETPVYAISYLYNFQNSISEHLDNLKLDGWCIENTFTLDYWAPDGIDAKNLWNDYWKIHSGNLYARNMWTPTFHNYNDKKISTLKCSENKTNKYANNDDMYVGMSTIEEVLHSGGIYENWEENFGISYMFPSVGSGTSFYVLNKYNSTTAMIAASRTRFGSYATVRNTNVFLVHREWVSGTTTLQVSGSNSYAGGESSVRPVVVLKKGVKTSGNGTQSDPYVIK